MATDPTAELFESIKRRGQVPALRSESAKILIELTHDTQVDKWVIEVRNGQVNVTRDEREQREAQCVVRADKAVFDRIGKGEENANAAYLRGELLIEGNIHLISAIERLFPGPPHAYDPRTVRAERTRQS